MKKIILAACISGALLFSGCVVLPVMVEDAINATSSVSGEEQVNALITEGVNWVDNRVSAATGGVGGAGILYLLSLYLRRNRKGPV